MNGSHSYVRVPSSFDDRRNEDLMLTTIMKYVAIATLLVGMFWWRIPANMRTYLDFAITAGAVFVLVQALNLRKYCWVAGFVGITCHFNQIQKIGFSCDNLVS